MTTKQAELLRKLHEALALDMLDGVPPFIVGSDEFGIHLFPQDTRWRACMDVTEQ